jgi:hypothetical protein
MMRPAALRIWAIAREMPGISDEKARGERMATMRSLQARATTAARIVFALLLVAVACMAGARYL